MAKVKLLIISIIALFLPLIAFNDTSEGVQWQVNWDSGVYYSFLNSEIGFGTSVSVINYAKLINLSAGMVAFKDFNPIYLVELGLNLKTLIEKIGGEMTYQLPFQIELCGWIGKDITIDKWHYGINANFIKIKF